MRRGRRGTARVGVITILDEEFEEARTALAATNRVTRTGCFTPNLGTLDCVVTQATDRANVAAGGAVGDLIENFRREVVILCGIAGGVKGRDGVALGDVVVGAYLHYWEFRKLGSGGDSSA